MGFFGFFGRKEKDRHDFDDDDREDSLNVRQRKAKLRLEERELKLKFQDLEYLKKKAEADIAIAKAETATARYEAELEELRGDDDDDGEGADQMALDFFGQILNKNPAPGGITSSTPVGALSGGQVQDILNLVPKDLLEKAKKMPDDLLLPFLQQKLPNFSGENLQQAIKILKK